MAAFNRLTEARLRKILSRQNPPKWGSKYEPSIKATREEAPSVSRFTEIWSDLLGRYISVLSTHEEHVLHIVLYCDRLFELQEQRMLPTLPAPHPLTGHPLAAGLQLDYLLGTVNLAEEIGVIEYHPTVLVKTTVGKEAIPYPWIGDFLLFLRDNHGPYCVNLTVKQSESDFVIPRVGITASSDLKQAAVKERFRHQVEKRLYETVGIPTFQVAGDKLNMVMVSNLMQIYGWCKRQHSFNDSQLEVVIDYFRRGVTAELSAAQVTYYLCKEYSYTPHDVKTAMYQAIWKRKIRIDLYQTFFFEQPMVPEHRDVLMEHASWFRRV